MNAPTAAEELVEDVSIANRAMKAIFHRGVGAARRVRDYDAEANVKAMFGDEGQIVTKKLFTNKQGLVYQRAQLANEMYSFHMKNTLPHGDDGSRLLPNNLYFEYTQTMGQFEHRLKSLDVQIMLDYHNLVAADIAERNAALIKQQKPPIAINAEYPTAAEMHRYLYVDWGVEPISTANDFRYQVDDHVKARLEQKLELVAVKAKADIFARMLPHMRKFVEKLAVPIGDKGAVFRDSLVENLNELTTELPKLNFDGDPNIDAAIKEIKVLVTPFVFNPDALREQPAARSAAKQKMEELVKKMEGYGYR